MNIRIHSGFRQKEGEVSGAGSGLLPPSPPPPAGETVPESTQPADTNEGVSTPDAVPEGFWAEMAEDSDEGNLTSEPQAPTGEERKTAELPMEPPPVEEPSKEPPPVKEPPETEAKPEEETLPEVVQPKQPTPEEVEAFKQQKAENRKVVLQHLENEFAMSEEDAALMLQSPNPPALHC